MNKIYQIGRAAHFELMLWIFDQLLNRTCWGIRLFSAGFRLLFELSNTLHMLISNDCSFVAKGRCCLLRKLIMGRLNLLARQIYLLVYSFFISDYDWLIKQTFTFQISMSSTSFSAFLDYPLCCPWWYRLTCRWKSMNFFPQFTLNLIDILIIRLSFSGIKTFITCLSLLSPLNMPAKNSARFTKKVVEKFLQA